MSKLFNKKYINYVILFTSIIFYIFLMFFSDITLDTGKKELENVIILALPCFMLLFYSFNIKDKEERKRIIIIYLILYLLTIIGFTFANFRDSVLIDKGISERGYNLIPFSGIKQMLNSPLGLKIGFYNIIGNFLMLTPLSILLPLIDDRFKKVKYYLGTIILFSLVIELFQYITEIGSFDVDDLILNISGSFILYLILIKTKLYDFLYKLFYEISIPKKVSNIIYYTLLVLILLVYIWYCLLIYIREQEKKVDFSNLKCSNYEKTYLGTSGRYNYYSECKLEGYVKRGNENIFADELVKSFASKIDNYSDELKLIKELAITDIKVILSKGTRKLIYDTEKQKKYLIDIEKISYFKNGVECIIEDSLPPNDIDCSADLVTVTKSDTNKGYVIQEGEYFNILSCITDLYSDSKVTDYYVPVNYELNENSCLKYNKN